jgi:hypothetical protein
MKKLIPLILLASCSKTYNCKITTTTDTPYYYNEHVYEIEVNSSRKDIKQYEADNTSITDVFPEGSITQVTVCK